MYLLRKPFKPLAKFRLSIISPYYLHVYVWAHKEEMQASTCLGGDYWGCYVGCEYKEKDGELFCPPKYGEIHLVKDNFGAGIFCHELTHFLLNWIATWSWDYFDKDNEDLARLMGEMTADFWRQYYNSFTT